MSCGNLLFDTMALLRLLPYSCLLASTFNDQIYLSMKPLYDLWQSMLFCQVHVFAPPPSNSTTFAPREQRVKYNLFSENRTLQRKGGAYHLTTYYPGELKHKVHGQRLSAVQWLRPLPAWPLLPRAGLHHHHHRHGHQLLIIFINIILLAMATSRCP